MAWSTGSAAASTRYGRTGSCRPSRSRASPTSRAGDAVVRGPGRRPYTAADAVAVRQLRGPRRVAAQRHADRCRRGLRQAGQDARRWRCLTARPSGTGRWPGYSPNGSAVPGPGTRHPRSPGSAARDVTRHLIGWFPGFLAPVAASTCPADHRWTRTRWPRGSFTATACRRRWTSGDGAPGTRQPARPPALGDRDRPVLHR